MLSHPKLIRQYYWVPWITDSVGAQGGGGIFVQSTRMTHCSIWLNRYLISTLHFWIWVLDFSHFETSFGLLNIFLDFYFWLTGRWDICWDDSHILSHVFVKSILGSVTFEREPVWLIGYSKKKMMTHNFVACLCQKQIGNSHLNILGQWRWVVRFFICECLFTSYAQ